MANKRWRQPKNVCRRCKLKQHLCYDFKDIESVRMCDLCKKPGICRLSDGRHESSTLEIRCHVNNCGCNGEEGEWDIRCIANIPEVKRLIYGVAGTYRGGSQ